MRTVGEFSRRLFRATGNSFGNTFDRRLPVVALVSYVIALFAWVAVMGRWLPMPAGEMAVQMSDPGVPEAMALSNGVTGIVLYLLMWGVMMIAMMYPSSVPLFRMYAKTLDGTTKAGKVARLGAFMGTYALVWVLTGIVPLGVNAVVPIATVASDFSGFLLGGTLVLLSGYQLSPYKHRCLRQCRSPLGFLLSHHRPGIRGAVRMSWQYSVFCVGCCWALFAFMVVAGTMNILWMGIITIVLSLERTVSWGPQLARTVGILSAFGGGSLVVVHVLAG
jgi:predicted metal-binding membrane protein